MLQILDNSRPSQEEAVRQPFRPLAFPWQVAATDARAPRLADVFQFAGRDLLLKRRIAIAALAYGLLKRQSLQRVGVERGLKFSGALLQEFGMMRCGCAAHGCGEFTPLRREFVGPGMHKPLRELTSRLGHFSPLVDYRVCPRRGDFKVRL